MATADVQPMLIESFYPAQELQSATAGRRLGAYALDLVITLLTLYIGWLIWFIIVAPRGQTPGKQLLGLYTMREDGTRAGGGYTWLRELVVKGLLFGLALSAISGGIVWLLAALWLLWDRNRQCLWDKVASTYIAYSPLGFRPMTKDELWVAGASLDPHAAAATSSATSAAPKTADVAEQLRELKRLYDQDLITWDEYQQRRARLVDRL